MSTPHLAHISPSGKWHVLSEHLHEVARRSSLAASLFGCAEWGRLAGLWHDLGKFRPGFQAYIRQANGIDAHIEGKVAGRDKTHSAAGALWAIQILGQKFGERGALAARVFAYLIASHHAGLYDWHGGGGLDARLSSEDSRLELEEALAASSPEILDAAEFTPDLTSIPGGKEGFALWVRMLFSCLVDADFLDTEAFFDSGAVTVRGAFPSLAEMLQVFDAHMAGMASSAPPSSVNVLRAEILDASRKNAELPPGFFTLTVPTGGGKTLSSLAFGLRHAVVWGKRRIVYAIPYTSIIEQTADVFRRVFSSLGDDVLVEHHSQADSDDRDETARSRLACENWDAPLIVTTNVQLFESLFAARTSRCRKLHNLVGSVIILDEAQQLPPKFLQPILDVLNLLVRHYSVSVVLCTATQPALATREYFDASRNLRGLADVREIAPEPDVLFSRLKRVNLSLPEKWTARMSWQAVADSIVREDCVLVIVGTRKAARDLHALMPPGTLHLSALMCGAHRGAVIGQIKARLVAKRRGEDFSPLRVISTQLVEAGVDLDFPVVWRALAGLDSIAQAAGRCNREGLIHEGGKVVVFVPPDEPPPGDLRKAADACVSTLHGRTEDPLSRGVFEAYFRQFYHACDLDAARIVEKLEVDRETLGVEFRSAAEAFRLIDDADQVSVIVRHPGAGDEFEMWINTLERDGPQRWLMRKLQRHIVNIRSHDAQVMLGRGLRLVAPGLYLQDADNLYHPQLGFTLDDVPFSPSGHVI